MKREPIDPEPQTDDVKADVELNGGDADETIDVATDSHLVETEGKS